MPELLASAAVGSIGFGSSSDDDEEGRTGDPGRTSPEGARQVTPDARREAAAAARDRLCRFGASLAAAPPRGAGLTCPWLKQA